MVSSSTSSAVPLKLVWKAAAMFFLKFTTSVFSYWMFRADLWWWLTFASHWNGVVLFPPTTPAKFQVTSDASGWWGGCGAWFQSSWFQFQWPTSAKHHYIAFKELLAVVVACTIWGGDWYGSQVSCRCDNQAAIQAIASRSCQDPSMMHLL